MKSLTWDGVDFGKRATHTGPVQRVQVEGDGASEHGAQLLCTVGGEYFVTPLADQAVSSYLAILLRALGTDALVRVAYRKATDDGNAGELLAVRVEAPERS